MVTCIDDYVKVVDVPQGSSVRCDCPVCNGTKTLSITNNVGDVVYNCYKAGCNVAGVYNLTRTIEEVRELLKSRGKEDKPFTPPDYWVYGIATPSMYKYLDKYNCLEAVEKGYCDVAYDPLQERLVFILYDKYNKIIGGVGRSLRGNKIKALNYHTSKEIPFKAGKGDTLVIVEDCASACAVARIDGYVGMALLGTTMSVSYLDEIGTYDRVIVALDKDARRKALKIRKYLTFYAKYVSVLLLTEDLKMLTKDKVKELISE